jgi:hypothetical protein
LPHVIIELGALVEPGGQGADAADEHEPIQLRPAVGEALDRLELLARPVVLAGQTAAGRALPDDDAERIALVRELLGRPEIGVVCWDVAPERPEGPHETVWGARPEDPSRLTAELRPHGEPGFLIVDGDADIVGWRPVGLQIIRLGPAPNSPLAALHRPDHDARDLRDAANWILLQDTFQGQLAL